MNHIEEILGWLVLDPDATVEWLSLPDAPAAPGHAASDFASSATVQRQVERFVREVEPDEAEFASLIGQAVDDLSEVEMSKLLQVSRPTINRWKNGRSEPHPLGRSRIVRQLNEELQRVRDVER